MEHELDAKHSGAGTLQPRPTPGPNAAHNRERRDRERLQRERLQASAQRFQQLEQMIVSDVAIFNELMEKAHDRYTANMDRYTTNNTTTIETFFDRLREDHREFQRDASTRRVTLCRAKRLCCGADI